MGIRDLVPADLGAAWALNQANLPAVGDVTRTRLEEITAMSTMALGAFAGDHLAGFCLVLAPGAAYSSVNYRWFADRHTDFVYLDRVVVSEQARGGGIGTALYAEVERRAGVGMLFTLEVNLEPRNDDSLAFHRRMGFVDVGTHTTNYGYVVSLQAKIIGDRAGSGTGP